MTDSDEFTSIKEYVYDTYSLNYTITINTIPSSQLKIFTKKVCEIVLNTKLNESGWDTDTILATVVTTEHRVFVTIYENNKKGYFCIIQTNEDLTQIYALNAYAYFIPNGYSLNESSICIKSGKVLFGVTGTTIIIPPKSFFLQGRHQDITDYLEETYVNRKLGEYKKAN